MKPPNVGAGSMEWMMRRAYQAEYEYIHGYPCKFWSEWLYGPDRQITAAPRPRWIGTSRKLLKSPSRRG